MQCLIILIIITTKKIMEDDLMKIKKFSELTDNELNLCLD